MATKELVDLEFLLFEDTYGKVGAQVLDVLLTRGRSTIPEIAKRTGLAPTAVMRTLVSLINHRFVLWWQVPRKRTFYSANWFQIYTLLWSGQLLASFPEEASILTRFLIDGCIKSEDAVKRGEGITLEQLSKLVAPPKRLLQVVRDFEFWPESELREDITAKQYQLIAGDPRQMALSEAAKKAQVASGVDSELNRLHRDDSRFGASAGLTPTAALTINWDRFLVVGRRNELVALATRKVGAISAKVYEQVLVLSEEQLTSVREPRVPGPDTSVPTRDVAARVSALGIDLASAFIELTGPVDKGESNIDDDGGDRPTKRVKTNEGFGIPKFGVVELVNKHLQLLEESPIRFIQRTGDRDGGEWYVPFNDVVADLQRATLDSIVAESFGGPAARLLRMIRDTGKTDEKMLGTRVLLHPTDIRHHMSSLHYYGLVDIQEVPRPSERAGQRRSYYMWYHRSDWAYLRLVQHLYRQIAEGMRAVRELRAKHETLIKKLGREDVQNEQDAYLTAKEKQELQEYMTEERALLAQQYLCDRHVRIFRDY